MSKKVSVKFTFPVTKNIFLSVTKPDDTFGADVYQTTLVYDKDVMEQLKAKIEGLDPSFKGLFKYKENDDGTAQVKLKQNKFIRWKDRVTGQMNEQEMKVTILNKDNTLYEGTEPWGGTIAEAGVVVETQAGAQKKGIILALRLRGLRIHELVTGGAGAGDGDPLFGGATATAPRPEQDVFEDEDLPFDVDENDDDAPI